MDACLMRYFGATNDNHPAFPVNPAVDAGPRAVARPNSGRWVSRLPAVDSTPTPARGAPRWVPVPVREVNVTPVGRPAFEGKVPKPPHGQTLSLVADAALTGWLQHPVRGLAWYQEEVRRRQLMEGENKEYTSSVLRPTLENTRHFIGHLLADRHFTEPLTGAERRALEKIDGQAAALLRAGQQVPYKRTVLVTFVFATLYDLLAQKRVLAPLAHQQPELLQQRGNGAIPSLYAFKFSSSRPDQQLQGQPQWQPQPVATIDPEQVVSCCWHGLNPYGPDQGNTLFGNDHLMCILLPRMLDNPTVFLYPSWTPLDVDDLCRLGHLPVYPIGLITDYAANADGFMHSPLRFITHDIFHIQSQSVGSLGQIEDARPLAAPASRCAFRQLMLDLLPQVLAPWRLKRAMELLVFHLLHEVNSRSALAMLEIKSFVPLLRVQAEARRASWCNYSRRYQGISDKQGAIAALWMHRLFAHWKASGFHLTDMQRYTFVCEFVRTDLPQLQWHLAYIEQHWTPLRELFFSESWEGTSAFFDGWVKNRRFGCLKAVFVTDFSFDFFHWKEPHSGCCLDYSDVLYFDRLHRPDGAEQIERATGSPIIHKTPF